MGSRVVLVLGVVTATGLALAVGRADTPAVRAVERPRFEYLSVPVVNMTASPADQLNKLGSDGWELVSVTAGGQPFQQTTAYFKRALLPSQPTPAPAKP